MDQTVSSFYLKNPEEGYIDTYDSQHGARLDAMIAHYGFGEVKGKMVADVGGGLGFLGKRLDPSNDYWVFDGAQVQYEKQLCKGTWAQVDIQRDDFASYYPGNWPSRLHTPYFDLTFCLETLEHLSDPYHCLVEIKKMTKVGGDIILSIPTETVWHNTIYCGLLWPRGNWEQFLGQMALPILDFWTFSPGPNQGWPAYHYRCVNRPWSDKVMLFPKAEAKFRDCTPLAATNL